MDKDKATIAKLAAPLPDHFRDDLLKCVQSAKKNQLIPFGVLTLFNNLISTRTDHKIKDAQIAINVSIDGHIATMGIGTGRDSIVFTAPPEDQADQMFLDKELRPYDRFGMILGHARVSISTPQWTLFSSISRATVVKLLDDRRMMSYNMVFGLAHFAAAQDFYYTMVETLAKAGKATHSLWCDRLQSLIG